MTTVSTRVYTAARKFPDNIALSCQGEKFSYAQLNESALKLAALIISKGLQKKNIGILTQKTFSAYCGVLGILYAGATYVPLNPKHPFGRLKNIVDNAQITAVIADESEGLDLEEFRKVTCVEHLLYPQKDLRAFDPLSEPAAANPDQLAYVMFTSGSTGDPKGVMVSHANVVSHIDNMTQMYGFNGSDRLSQTFDLSFDPSVSDMFCAWFNGACLCALSAEDIYCASEYIQRERITFWASVPTLANFMIRLGNLEPDSFPSLRYSTFCGEPLPQSLANQWSKAAVNSTIENLYGPTEATVYVTRHIYRQEEQTRKYSNNIVPIGHPLPGQEAAIVAEDLTKVPQGQVGELCVAGSQVTQGYLKDEAKTAKVFVKMPWETSSRKWYRTGDLAFVNENGDIECLGRIDSQIKLGGQRIELGEIEAVLREAANTMDVAVVPVLYENGVPQRLAAFVARELSESQIKDIQGACQKMLQPVFVPKNIYSLEALPLNASGKIDRKALKDLAASMEKR